MREHSADGAYVADWWVGGETYGVMPLMKSLEEKCETIDALRPSESQSCRSHHNWTQLMAIKEYFLHSNIS